MRVFSKKQKKKMAVLWLTGCLAAVLCGCGSASTFADSKAADTAASVEAASYVTQNMGGGYLMEDAFAEEIAVETEAGEAPGAEAQEVDSSAANANSSRKLIKTVNLSVETKEFDLVMDTLEKQIDALGGYIENMDTYNGSTYYGYGSTRNASMTIRIPKDQLNGFLATVSEISNVVSRSENVEDVTLAYVDLESHKNALRTEQTRLLELLEKAESIEDIITIEERLSDVRYQLESMESQLRTYDNKVDYSTVYLYIDEVKELTPVEEETTWERIAGGFLDSLKDIGDGLKEFGIWFLVHIPYMVVWAVVIIVVILIIKKMRKRRKARKAKSVSVTETQNSSK